MKKTTSLLVAFGLLAASASFASSSDVITLHLNTADQQGHYVKANFNGRAAGVECVGNDFTLSMNNDDIPIARALGVIKLGSNGLTFTECNNAACSQTGKQIPVHFNLSQSGSTYSASPSDITLNFDAFGETCSPGLKGHHQSFLD